MESAPLIDFKVYGLGVGDASLVEENRIQDIGKAVVDNFKTYGLCYVKNHGIDAKLIDVHFKVFHSFFELPTEEKEVYKLNKGSGWVKTGEFNFDPKCKADDLNESLVYMPAFGYEAWPDTNNLKGNTEEFYRAICKFSFRFFDALSLGLDQAKDFMRKVHVHIGEASSDKNWSRFKSLYYPPIAKDEPEDPNQSRCGQHADYGTVSFLFENGVGGLKIINPDGSIIAADPIPGAVLVLAAHALQRWTANAVKAAAHRVPFPREENRRKATRQSCVFFVHPDNDHVIVSGWFERL